MTLSERMMAIFITPTTIGFVLLIALALSGTMTYRRHRATTAEYPRSRPEVLREALSDLGAGLIVGGILVGLFVAFEEYFFVLSK